MRIPLTIDSNYVPSWGTQEGLREFITNWLDANADGLKNSCSWKSHSSYSGESAGNDEPGTVTLYNEGVDIGREALLIGCTTKYGDDGQRGQFGEGIKLGTLALLREGKTVRITTQSEFWTASLGEHETFPGREVVVFNTRSRHGGSGSWSKVGGVTVQIGGVTLMEYEKVRSMFLEFRPVEKTFNNSPYGTLLIDPALRGHTYVKGILVEVNPKLAFGYNLMRVEVDRDRKMVNRYSAGYAMSCILGEAAKTGVVDLYQMYEDGNTDGADYSYRIDGVETVAAKFKSIYGEDAMPCTSAQEALELEHAGVKGIPVSGNVLNILKRAGMDAKAQAKANLQSPKKIMALQDLTVAERAALQWASYTLAKSLSLEPSTILGMMRVVEFHGNILGLYRNGSIDISRKVLSSRAETLVTMVHEYAHNMGGDGSHDHVATMESIYSKIISLM